MASLETLPFELLEHITTNLCLHCNPRPPCKCAPRCVFITPSWFCATRIDVAAWDRKGRTLALAALCLTSHRLKHAATHHLYHHPNPKKWWLLANTLLHHPTTLAQQVKTLYLPENTADEPPPKSALPPQVLSHYQTHLDTYFSTTPTPILEPATELETTPQQRHHQNQAHLWQTNNTNDVLALLATLSPAVERIEAVVGYTLGVELLHLSAPVALFRAAPGLRVLRCHAVSDEGDEGEWGEEGGLGEVVNAALRRVEFGNSAMSAGALAGLLKACPGLEVFEYEAGGACIGYEQFHPSQARDLMMQHGKRLERVAMHMGMVDYWEDTYEQWDGGDVKRLVRAFKERGVEFEVTGLR